MQTAEDTKFIFSFIHSFKIIVFSGFDINVRVRNKSAGYPWSINLFCS